MRSWTPRAARGASLAVLLLLLAALPGVELVRLSPIPGPASVNAAAHEYGDEPPGLVAEHAIEGSQPAPSAGPRLLIIGELVPSKAEIPSGPTTYVPIILYHYIRINPNPRDREGFSLSTPPAMFAAQMQYLADHGFHVLPLHQAVVAIKNHTPLPARPVALTFDDGYADFFTQAVPILARYGFTATNFVITGRMGLPGFMTPSQVVAADAMGFDIGAHTVDHVMLAATSTTRATWEMRQSKLALEELLGHPVLDFAYPYGSFNLYDMAEARTLGFETAVSTLYGVVHYAGQLFDLSRVRIGGGLPLTDFAREVGGPLPTVAELRA